MWIIAVIGFVVAAIAIAYRGMSAIWWTTWLALALLSLNLAVGWLMPLAIISAMVLLAWSLVTHVKRIRLRLISAPLARLARRVMPEISATEQEAMEAGSVSWDGEIFKGLPDWSALLETQPAKLLPREQDFIDGPVEQLCRMLNDWEITHQQDLNQATWDFIRDNGFFGMVIPRHFGGLGLSAYAHSMVVMKIASRSISASVTVMVPNSLGPAELLLFYGTPEQQKYYLPRLAKGQDIPCFALTSEAAGSDAGALEDSGVVCYGDWQGQRTLGLKLNWNKRYITLAPVATLLGLAVKVRDPEHLLGEQEDRGITCVLVPTHLPGVQTQDRHLPLSAAFMNGPTRGKNVFIPLEQIIGGEEYIGKGWAMLMENLAVGRSISLPALSTGTAKFASYVTGAYSRIREQFNRPVGHFEGVEEMLAKIGGLTYLMDCSRTVTTSLIDQGAKPSVLSAVLKYHLTEDMRNVLSHAMDIHAGRGLIQGPRNYLANAYQAVPISITVEGSNILTRSMMIFGQGLMRCHPFLMREIAALHDQDKEKGQREFDRLYFLHVQHDLQLLSRGFVSAFSPHWRFGLSKSPSADIDPYMHQLSRVAAGLGLLTDFSLLTLGGKLKFKEKLLARHGDILSYIYLATTVIKHYKDQGYPSEDKALMDWAVQHCLFQIQEAFEAILNNFPRRMLAGLLRLCIFPLGRSYHKPSDALGHKVARILLAPSTTRDRLISGIYLTQNPKDPVGLVEKAFQHKVHTEPLEHKLKKAIQAGQINKSAQDLITEAERSQILTQEQAKELRDAQTLITDAIRVDAFEPENLPMMKAG